MEWKDVVNVLIGGGLFTAVSAFIAQRMDWIRFKKKDKADIDKIQSDTAVSNADAHNKRIDDEVKISKAALEWTVQLAGQLERANAIAEKKQTEIEGMRVLTQALRDEMREKIDHLEAALEVTQQSLMEERRINKELLDKLNKYMDGTNGGQK